MAPEECAAREFHVQRILAGSEVLDIANELRSRCIEAGPHVQEVFQRQAGGKGRWKGPTIQFLGEEKEAEGRSQAI